MRDKLIVCEECGFGIGGYDYCRACGVEAKVVRKEEPARRCECCGAEVGPDNPATTPCAQCERMRCCRCDMGRAAVCPDCEDGT
jgi:hypothetical protein